MTIATDFREMTEDLLADLGRTVTYRQRAQNIDADSGIPTPGSATDTTLNGAVISLRDREPLGSFAPEVQKLAHAELLVASKDLDDASLTPAKGDQVVIGSATHEVVGFGEIAVQDASALHSFLLRS